MTRQADEQKSMDKISGGAAEKTTVIRTYDQAAVAARMRELRAEVAQKKATEVKRREELAAVTVTDADVAVAAEALNLSEADARRRLQEKKGDLVATLRDAAGLPRAKA